MGKQFIQADDPLVSFAAAHADYIFAEEDRVLAKGILARLGLHKAPQATQIPPKRAEKFADTPSLSDDHKDVRDFPQSGDVVHHVASKTHYRVEGVDKTGTVSTSKRPAAGGSWQSGEKWSHEQWHRAHDQGSFKLVQRAPRKSAGTPSSGGRVGEPLVMKSVAVPRSDRDERDILTVALEPNVGDLIFLNDASTAVILEANAERCVIQKSDEKRKLGIRFDNWGKWCKSYGVAVEFAPLFEQEDEAVEIVDDIEASEPIDAVAVIKSRGLRPGDKFASVPKPGFSNVDTHVIIKSFPNGMVGVEEVPWADMSRQIYIHSREIVGKLESGALRLVELAPDDEPAVLPGVQMCRKCGVQPVSAGLPGGGYCDGCLTVVRRT